MGWNSWNALGSDVDECAMRETAQALVDTGLRDLGYEYVIGDCWSVKGGRGPRGEFLADPDRFPSGIAALADECPPARSEARHLL